MEIATNPAIAAKQDIAKRGSLIGSDFQTFLKMLTAQIQNQDPLNPMESGDFAVQLATFSGVEQQVRSNDLLADLGEEFASAQFAQLNSWLGQEVRVSSAVSFEGTPIDLHLSVPAGTEAAELLVYDSQGMLLGREAVRDSGPYRWAGQSAEGTPFPDGLYRFEMLIQSGGAPEPGPPVQSYSKVIEVQHGPNGPTLTLASGMQVAASEVSALREPEG